MKNKVKGGRLADTAAQPFSALIVAALVATLSVDAYADRATDKNPLELRKVMRDLGKNMQAASDAISREDWARVAAIAPAIAEHPQPPMGEKVRILAFIGGNVPRFRAFDGQTHDAAYRMADAATKKDGAGVIAAFADIQTGCLGCHQAFRKAFVEHFYGAP